MTAPKTFPQTFYTLLDQLQDDPTSKQVARLAKHLATRTNKLTRQLNDSHHPVALFAPNRYETLSLPLEQVRTCIKPFGLDFISVPATCVQGVLTYLHLQQAEGGPR